MAFDLDAVRAETASRMSRPIVGEAASAGRDPLAVGDWHRAIADAHARIDASERRIHEVIDALARRVEAAVADVDSLRRGNDGPVRDLERRLVDLSDRVGRLEDRLAHSGGRR